MKDLKFKKIRKNMLVICINDKGTTKLVKNQKYKITQLYENRSYGTANKHCEHNGVNVTVRRIQVEGVGSYFVDRFKLVNGKNFYDIPLFRDEVNYNENRISNGEDLTGQYILCTYEGNSKYLKSGQIYQVERHTRESWSGKIKIKGLRSFVGTYGFDKIPLKEQRKIKLQNMSGTEIKTGLDKRKFLYYSEDEKLKIIFELLAISIKNLSAIENLKNYTIVDMIVKVGSKYNIIEDDIKPLMRKSLSRLMKDIGLY
jgi:hypothetical protein